MPISGPARPPGHRRPSRRGGPRQRRRLHGAAPELTADPAGLPVSGRRRPRRTREQRRNLRSAAFDLLAVLAALALVGLGLANLYLVGSPDLAARQGIIAGVGVLALAVFWRFRVRYLVVLGWAAYGAAVVFLVGVLTVGLTANGATRWIALGSF